MENFIYVVVGHCGEYDDYRTWNTQAFKIKSMAEVYCKRCQKEADRITDEMVKLDDEVRKQWSEKGSDFDYKPYTEKTKKIMESNKIDPDFDYDEPIGYTIDELKLY